MKKQISRKRIVELLHEATEEPYKFDDGWIARFMTKLNQESPSLAKAVRKAANKRSKEMQ